MRIIRCSQIDLAAELQTSGIHQTSNPSTLHVIQHNAASGLRMAYGNCAYARSEYDRPFRWCDGSIEICRLRV
jgi:hypothetical protein